MTVSASDPQPVHVPARARHTFKADDTHEGPCTVEISTSISPKSDPNEPEANGASSKLSVYAVLYIFKEMLMHRDQLSQRLYLPRRLLDARREPISPTTSPHA